MGPSEKRAVAGAMIVSADLIAIYLRFAVLKASPLATWVKESRCAAE